MFDAVATWFKSWFTSAPRIPPGADLASERWDDVPSRPLAPLWQWDTPTPPPQPVLHAAPRQPTPSAPTEDAGEAAAEAAEWQTLLARAKEAASAKTPEPVKAESESEDWEAVIERAKKKASAAAPAATPAARPTTPPTRPAFRKNPNERLEALIRNVRLRAPQSRLAAPARQTLPPR